MEKDAYEAAQSLDKQVLIWAIVFLFAAGLVMFRLVANQLSAILKQLQVTVDKLALGFERHNVLLEEYGKGIKENRSDIMDLQRKRTR